jgi:hypothetical protein
MTFSSMPVGVTDAPVTGYSLTIDATETPGLKTFNIIYINNLGVVTTIPISYTVIWKPVDGPSH